MMIDHDITRMQLVAFFKEFQTKIKKIKCHKKNEEYFKGFFKRKCKFKVFKVFKVFKSCWPP